MALVQRDRHVTDWPWLDLPERWRRWFDFGEDTEGWLRVEEFHDGDTLVVRCELPDIDPKNDVQVTVASGVVRIEAHREEKTENKSKQGYRSEFRYGSVAREFALPKGTTADDVKASYSDGILEVRLPCPHESQAEVKTVEVTSG